MFLTYKVNIPYYYLFEYIQIKHVIYVFDSIGGRILTNLIQYKYVLWEMVAKIRNLQK